MTDVTAYLLTTVIILAVAEIVRLIIMKRRSVAMERAKQAAVSTAARDAKANPIGSIVLSIVPLAIVCSCLIIAITYAVELLADQSMLRNYGVSVGDDLLNELSSLTANFVYAALLLSIIWIVLVLRLTKFENLFRILQFTRPHVSTRRILVATLALGLTCIYGLGWLPMPKAAQDDSAVTIILADPMASMLFDPIYDFGFNVVSSDDTTDSFVQTAISSALAEGRPAHLLKSLSPFPLAEGDNLKVEVESLSFLPDSTQTIDTFTVTGSDPLALLSMLREKVYAKFAGRASPRVSLDLGTDNVQAYSFHLQGLLDLNRYDQKCYFDAIENFRQAEQADSGFTAPTLRRAYCYNMLVDKKIDTSRSREWLGEVIDALHKTTERDGEVGDHPLFLKVKGDYAYLMGKMHLDAFFVAARSVTTREFEKGLLLIAEDQFRDAQELMVAAVVQSPRYFKLKFNISQIYYQMFRVLIERQRFDSASIYLDLAERAMNEASDLYSYDNGPAVELGRIKFSRFKWLDATNELLLIEADSILQAVVADSSARPHSNVWTAYARYHLAALALYENDPGEAFHQLCKADSLGVFRVIYEAAVDPEFSLIWDSISGVDSLQSSALCTDPI